MAPWKQSQAQQSQASPDLLLASPLYVENLCNKRVNTAVEKKKKSIKADMLGKKSSSHSFPPALLPEEPL
jgi:hypothetical protein